MIYRILICALTSLSLLGCTTMRPMDAASTELTTQLEPGDHIIVYERSGRVIDMTLTEIGDGMLHGHTDDPAASPVTVDIRDIERLEVEKIDPGKSVLAGVGTVIIVVPLILIAALAASGPIGIPDHH